MKKQLMIMALLASIFLLPACVKRSSVKGVEPVPGMKTYSASLDKVWPAVADTLVARNIIFQADDTLGKIETEWFEAHKIPGWEATFTDLNYKAKEFITVRKTAEDTSVRFQARFRQQFMLMPATEDEEFPEAENFLRKRFFEDLDAALAALSAAAPKTETPPPPPPPPSSPVERKKIMVNHGNIRSKPSANSRVIAKAHYGQEIEVLSQNGQWYEVMAPSGQKGWVHEVLFKPKPRKKETMPAPETNRPGSEPSEPASEATVSPVLKPVEEISQMKQNEGDQPASSGAAGTDDPSGTYATGSGGMATREKPAQVIVTDIQPKETAEGQPAAQPAAPGNQEPGSPQTGPSAGQGPTAGKAAEGQVQTSGTSSRPAVVYLRVSDKGPARLLEEPNAFARVVGSVPSGMRVECISKVASFYQVQYQGKTGYLYKDFCEEVE